jgi:cytochrome c556
MPEARSEGQRSLLLFAIFICAGQVGLAAEAQQSQGEEMPASAPLASTPMKAEDADAIIFDRQQLMLKLETDADMMGSIVAGEAPPTKLAETAKSIAQGARDSYEAFKPQAPGGRAKADIWTNWPDYSQRMESFIRNADAAAKMAETGNVAAVTSMLGEALPCKQCHDVYRIPKKN